MMMEERKLPRMLPARKAAEELKRIDPNTRLGERALRRLVHEGKIPFVQIGKRQLINVDWFVDQLNQGASFASPTIEERAAELWINGIRAVPEKVR